MKFHNIPSHTGLTTVTDDPNTLTEPAQQANSPGDRIYNQSNYSTTNTTVLPLQQTTNEFEIPQGVNQNGKDSFKELLYSQHADIRKSADIEEPNVPSIEDEEPTELVNAEDESILERSTTESRDVPTVAASLIDHALSTTN
ncbi:hypothetical protein K3495_g602 [Podosphaera aphanis]|nr:hypothetical protein K3495_g602 [Podosphaera aphanis]